MNATWFKISEKYALQTDDEKPFVHPFYDAEPEFDKDKRLINFFVTVPSDSKNNYELDLLSGRLYKERSFCETLDTWENYKKNIFLPNFTFGIVPRTINEVGKPQKIAVFSDSAQMLDFSYRPANYMKVRIVGSVIYEYCDSYPCDTKDKWEKTQILVAVNSLDSHFSDVMLLKDLKEKIDWDYFKAFLSSEFGAHQLGSTYYPAYRITKEYSVADALDYFLKNSKLIDLKKRITERESCFKLYDDFYESVLKIKATSKTQVDDFFKLFKGFYLKNGKEFYNCQKLYRTSNVNLDPDRFWFFTYIQAFFNLEKNGFFYSCNEKSWFYNPKVNEKDFFNDPVKEMEKCKARDFEKSFDLAINGISLMRNQMNKSYRFVEYDSSFGGSHQKIYSWIPDFGKKNFCSNMKNNPSKEASFDIFPQDVVWPQFLQEDSKIIR